MQFVCWIVLLQMINLSMYPSHLPYQKQAVPAVNRDVLIDEAGTIFELIEGVAHHQLPDSNEDEMDTSSPPFELYFATHASVGQPDLYLSTTQLSHYHNKYPVVHQQPHFPPPKLS